MYSPGYQEFVEKTKKGNLIPVYREILADLETPVSAFMKINKGENAFLLESVEGSEQIARYSFLGVDPSVVFTAGGGTVRLVRSKGKNQSEPLTHDPLNVLKKYLANFKAVTDESLPPFFGGAVGYIGYDTVRYFERLPRIMEKDDRNLPDCVFMITDTVLVFDHFKHSIKVVANAHVDGKADTHRVYQQTCKKIDALVACLKKPLRLKKQAAGSGAPVSLSPDFDRSHYMQTVEKVKEYIRAGDIIQGVLSQRLTGKVKVDPFALYRVLRTINPSPYMFYLKIDGLHLVGSSPEMLVKVKDGIVETRPIAGTRPRGANGAEDERMVNELLSDSKERAEHVMLVDLGRNDIGRVSEYGSVQVDEFMKVEMYSHVMHIVSHVTGRLKPGLDRFDAFRACFPAGTVSGAPKIRAMEIIEELEPHHRGPYAGAVGYFSFNGTMDTCIAIRTIIIQGDMAYIQVGAGIVFDSRPDKEYEETLNKAKALLKTISLAEEGLLEE